MYDIVPMELDDHVDPNVDDMKDFAYKLSSDTTNQQFARNVSINESTFPGSFPNKTENKFQRTNSDQNISIYLLTVRERYSGTLIDNTTGMKHLCFVY